MDNHQHLQYVILHLLRGKKVYIRSKPDNGWSARYSQLAGCNTFQNKRTEQKREDVPQQLVFHTLSPHYPQGQHRLQISLQSSDNVRDKLFSTFAVALLTMH